MYMRPMIAVAALSAALVLALVVGTAGARRFEVSEQRFQLIFEELGYEGSESPSTKCRATIQGSFHSRTISKVSGQLVGYITQASFQHPCRENEAWLLNGTEAPGGVTSANTLPWHLRYVSFAGTLPTITTIKIAVIGWAYLELCILESCLYKSTAESPAFLQFLRGSEGKVTTGTWEGITPKFSGPVICPAQIRIQNSGEMFAGASLTTRINVRLVQ